MILTLALVLLISSCATNSFDEKRSSTFTTQIPEELPSHYDLKKVLSRKIKMAGGDYEVTALPYTESYIKALALDLTDERHLTPKDSKKLLAELRKRYLDKKVCFLVSTSVLKFEKAAKLTDWRLHYIPKSKTEFPLKWIQTEVAIKHHKQRSGDKLISWLNEGTVCSTNELSFNDSFFLKLKATYTPFPFSSESLLYWHVFKKDRKAEILTLQNQVAPYKAGQPAVKKQENKVEDKEEKEEDYRPAYKKYRGW